MKRVWIIGLLMILIAGVAGVTFNRTNAQAANPSKAATASALETQVAALQTQIADLTKPEGNPPMAGTPASPPGAKPKSKSTVVATDAGIDLLYVYTVKDSYKGSDILGEVKNTTKSRVGAPTVRITFYDKEGKIVDTQEVHAVIGVLNPGESMPIDGRTNLALGSWKKTSVTIEADASDFATNFYSSDVSIENVNETQKTTDALTVLGEVKNNGSAQVNGVQVYALAYDAKGRYIGKSYGNVNSDKLAPGQSAPFKVDDSFLRYPNGWTYRLVASAYKSS